MRGRALTSPEGPGAARRLFIVLAAAAAAFGLSRRLRGRDGRERGRAAGASRAPPPAGAEVGGSERAGGGAARGPLTRFRLSAARARAASARVTPERKRDSPGAAARERPWPTRTSSSTSSSETQVGEPGPERGGERRGRPGSPRPFPQCWQCRRRGGSARGRGGVSPPPLRRAPPAASALCLDGLGPLAAASGPGWRVAGPLGLCHGPGCGGRARQRGARRRCHSETYTWVVPVVCIPSAARPHSTPQFCDEFLPQCCELPSAQAARIFFQPRLELL